MQEFRKVSLSQIRMSTREFLSRQDGLYPVIEGGSVGVTTSLVTQFVSHIMCSGLPVCFDRFQ